MEVSAPVSLNEERTRQIRQIIMSHGYSMSETDYIWNGNLFEIISQLTDNKLSNEEMTDAADILSDLILGRRPDLIVHVAKEDRIRAQMRIMEILPATRGKLTTAEKERFAFCIYLEFCTREVDEEKGQSYSGIVEFISADHILKEFHEDKAMFPERYAAAETFTEEEPFGYSMNHPICSVTVGSSYQYLNRLLYLNGRIASHERKGSTRNSMHQIIDLYLIDVEENNCNSASRKTITLYVYADAMEESATAPEGFCFRKSE